MIPATGLHPGMAVRLDGAAYRVLEAEAHGGSGKPSGFVHARLLRLGAGTETERRFRLDEKVEALDLSKRGLEYSYQTGDEFYFMDPASFEQLPVPREILGEAEPFLKEGMRVHVELLGEQPVAVILPETVDLRVTSTAAPMHAHETSTLKRAVLENGMEVLVPLFIKEGEVIRIAVAGKKYVERVREGKK